jgi:nicotinamide-nucleotide amidase
MMQAPEVSVTGDRTAAVVAVGTELLGQSRVDTNSLEVAGVLARHGVRVVEKRVVGDDVDDIARAVRDLLGVAPIVVLCGGLGPTADDLTRVALARALGRELRHDVEIEAWLRERYRSLGRHMPEVCATMARVVEGSTPLLNSRGAAPGVLIEADERLVMALPGVPGELCEMLREHVEPELERRFPGASLVSRTLVLGGVLESEIEERIAHLYERHGREAVTILAAPGTVRLVLSAAGPREAAARRLELMVADYRAVLGDDVAGEDVSGLAEATLRLLTGAGQTLATAESCTGGLVSAWLTDVPGSSAAYVGGVVSYRNDVKESSVGVPGSLLVEHGAVSEPVARSMAEQVRRRLATDWGVGITGIAGPGGGTADKPVGLVHWAVAGPEGTWHQSRVFSGDRSVVRRWSASSALDLLRRQLQCRGGAAS